MSLVSFRSCENCSLLGCSNTFKSIKTNLGLTYYIKKQSMAKAFIRETILIKLQVSNQQTVKKKKEKPVPDTDIFRGPFRYFDWLMFILDNLNILLLDMGDFSSARRPTANLHVVEPSKLGEISLTIHAFNMWERVCIQSFFCFIFSCICTE